MRRFRGRAGQTKRGEMNQTEAAYALILEAQKQAGEIVDYWFEAITLKLAPDCRYTPDFLVMEGDGTLSLIETKAGRANGSAIIEDDAKVKLAMLRVIPPFTYFKVVLAVSRGTGSKRTWDIKEIGGESA